MINKCNGSIVNLDEEVKFVTEALNNFLKSLEKKNIEISNLEAQQTFRDVNKHYKTHRDTYKRICYVKNCDIFKIISWFAMFLYQSKKEKMILIIACLYMNKQLKKCKREVSSELIFKIVAMLLNDSKNDKVAIGKNGLYMAFRLANEVNIKT
ncbi:hypothetical protein [Helicobacter sp.]|uniref:hypothetical protein n=1 Tax=Helicobacter sp. TaxID=218 RepID=UPI0019BAE561|nr:hypothetical protein [Helicobacter sp.]MBD5165809.1 hypothetical protein [Helicobacter sp.]